jgi:hypothetical protein
VARRARRLFYSLISNMLSMNDRGLGHSSDIRIFSSTKLKSDFLWEVRFFLSVISYLCSLIRQINNIRTINQNNEAV